MLFGKYVHYYLDHKVDRFTGRASVKPRRQRWYWKATKRDAVVLDTTQVPPTQVNIPEPIGHWPEYWSGQLPDQWIDFEGNLRNSQGRLVFAA